MTMVFLSSRRAISALTQYRTLITTYYYIRRRSIRRTLSTNATENESKHFDVLIVGGGVVGATLAKQVKQQLSGGCSIGLVERGPSPLSKQEQRDSSLPPHPRAYALSPHSLKLLGRNVLDQVQMGQYDSMQLWEQDSPSTLVFSQNDLNFTSSEEQPVLGAVVEDEPLVKALWKNLEEDTSASTFAEATIEDLQLPKSSNELVKLTLKQTETQFQVTTRLLVAADGANSMIRRACGIPWLGWEYGKTAATFTVETESNHNHRRAFQRFLPNGPVALLPTYSKDHSTIVWSTTPQHARQLVNMDSEQLVHELNQTLQVGPQRLPPLMQDRRDSVLHNILYGAERLVDTMHYGLTMSHWAEHEETFVVPPKIVDIPNGPRFAFELSCRQAESYIASRVALVGDAAHTVHPMAGQGLNLGLQDVAVLANTIQRAHDAGMDVGMDHMFLQSYHQDRKLHNSIAMGGIHALHEMFGVLQPSSKNEESFPRTLAHHTKSLGMNLVNHIGPIRRKLVSIATQGTS